MLRSDFGERRSWGDIRTTSFVTLRAPLLWTRVLGLAGILWLGLAQAFAHDVTLSWDPGSEPELAGYRVYYGTVPGSYTAVIDVGNVTTCGVTGLASGEYFFAVTAYNWAGLESGFSEEVSAALEVPSSRPNALTITGGPEVRPASAVATVTWSSNRPFFGAIEWGPTPALGSILDFDTVPMAVSTRILSGLQPGTLYYYRIRMADTYGNLVVSPVTSFRTDPASSEEVRGSFVFPLPESPHVPNASGGLYVGLAVANLGSASALITYRAFDFSGSLVSGPGITNPTYRKLSAGEQAAELDTQLFGTAMSSRAGWVEVDTTTPQSAAIFLQFNGDLSEGDGAGPSESPGLEWILPEIDSGGWNYFTVVNPGLSTAEAEIALIDGDGSPVRRANRTIPAGGSVRASVFEDLFPGLLPASSQYLRVTATGPVVASGSIRRIGAWRRFVRGMKRDQGATVLYAPQYIGGAGWTSSLTVINLDSKSGTVYLQFVPEDPGSPVEMRSFPISPLGKLQVAEPGLFAISSTVERRGFLVVAGDDVRLTGIVSFGDAAGKVCSTALPLEAATATELLIPHVASDASFFTGLALLNPGSLPANAAMDLFAPDGSLIAGRTQLLLPRQRLSRLLTEWFPSLEETGKKAGYVRISADSGIAAFALFGTHRLTMLSAIPARKSR